MSNTEVCRWASPCHRERVVWSVTLVAVHTFVLGNLVVVNPDGRVSCLCCKEAVVQFVLGDSNFDLGRARSLRQRVQANRTSETCSLPSNKSFVLFRVSVTGLQELGLQSCPVLVKIPAYLVKVVELLVAEEKIYGRHQHRHVILRKMFHNYPYKCFYFNRHFSAFSICSSLAIASVMSAAKRVCSIRNPFLPFARTR